MAARSVGLWVMRREVHKSSSKLRFWSASTVFWFSARRSARWERVCRRISRLNNAKEPATDTSVTRVPNNTRRAPRLIPASPRDDVTGASREGVASVTDGCIFQRDGEVHGGLLAGSNQELASNRPGSLMACGDG